MNKLAFADLYAENLDVGLFITFFIIILVFLILRKQIYSLFDPIIYLIIAGGSGYSVVFFLYYFDYISSYYFYSFIATQLAFFAGILINKKMPFERNCLQQESLPSYSGVITIIYPLAVILYVSCQLIVYYNNGIPLLMASRLEIFSGGSGFGLVNRIIQVCQVIAIAVAFYRILLFNKCALYILFDSLVILFGLLVAVLSGSKSAILLMVFILSYTTIFIKYRFNVSSDFFRKVNRFSVFLFIACLAGAMITIVFQVNDSNLKNAIAVLAMRFINTGDIYFMSYPYGLVDDLEPGSFFLALFKDIFGVFRILDWDVMPVNLGLQVFWSHYNTDMVSGPNPRHNIFGLFYLGPIISLFYSFVIGYIFSFIRNKFLFKVKPNFLGLVFYILIASNTIFLEQDMTYTIGQYVSVLVVFLPLYIASYFLAFVSYKFKKRVSNE